MQTDMHSGFPRGNLGWKFTFGPYLQFLFVEDITKHTYVIAYVGKSKHGHLHEHEVCCITPVWLSQWFYGPQEADMLPDGQISYTLHIFLPHQSNHILCISTCIGSTVHMSWQNV